MKKNSSTKVLLEMRDIYYKDCLSPDTYLDWMGYPINEENSPCYHHIVKKSSLRSEKADSKPTVENGAYLGVYSHDVLHYIERIDKGLYDAWNSIFSVINKERHYPDADVWNIVFSLQDATDKILDSYLKMKEEKKAGTYGRV